jgi:hypothetical protein
MHIAFALGYGFCIGGFTAVFAGTATEIRRMTSRGNMNRAEPGSVAGLFSHLEVLALWRAALQAKHCCILE